jgi:thiamine pyrophosphokinase
MSIVIVFAAGDHPPPDIIEDLPLADLVVAADGGYQIAAALGQRVDLVVGDLDSIAVEELPGHVVVERYPEDKDATDLELAIAMVARDNPERLIVVGGAGGRIDHEMAVAGLICSPRWAHIDEIEWVSGRARAYVIRGTRRIQGDVGATVSLLAMGGEAGQVTTRGLHWELSGGTIAPDGTLGVSNRMVAPVAEIRVGWGCLLALFPVG